MFFLPSSLFLLVSRLNFQYFLNEFSYIKLSLFPLFWTLPQLLFHMAKLLTLLGLIKYLPLFLIRTVSLSIKGKSRRELNNLQPFVMSKKIFKITDIPQKRDVLLTLWLLYAFSKPKGKIQFYKYNRAYNLCGRKCACTY